MCDMKRKNFTITIDLGKGVRINAPFKKKWTLAEWRRMNAYIDECVGNVAPQDELEAFR